MGALCGALPIFIICGALIVLGFLVSLNGSTDFLNTIALGNIFSPHIAFAGGVAASAFARHRKMLKSGKDITTPLISMPGITVVLVGGLFGVLGALLMQSFDAFKFPLNTMALAVFVSNVVARLLFAAKPKVHNHPPLWDRLKQVRPPYWLPWQSPWPHTILVGIILGGVYSQITLSVHNPLLGFGLAAVSLIFVEFGSPLPVTHHIALVAGLAAIRFSSLTMGAVFGLIAAILAEISARIWYTEGDTHVDPPAFAIAAATLLLSLIS